MKILQGLKQKQITLRLMLSAKIAIVFLALFLMTFISAPFNAYALTDQENLDLINQQVQHAKNKLNQTAAERKTLQGEVAYFDGQIGYTEAQIAATNAEIAKLNKEIADTQEKIKQSEADLALAREKLGEIMRTMYEEGQVSNIELVARSKSFSEFVDRAEYIEVVQLRIKETADQVIKLKNELDAKKTALEENKKKQEELKKQQVAQSQSLEGQRNSKAGLLAAVQGNEEAYQALVKKLQSQYYAAQQAIWAKANPGGGYVSLGHVSRGDVIGYEGNSGYSTGPHLHFEYKINGYRPDPLPYISSGQIGHPMPGAAITQYYGENPALYGGGGHPGIDYAAAYGTPIRAVLDGDIIYRQTGRPNTYPWSFEYGNYVLIQHSNGAVSLYAHMQ